MTTVPALTDEAALNQYVATGGQTDFNFSFMIFATADIEVYVNGVLKTEVTDYTVKKSGGGSITSSDLPLDGGKVVFGSGLTADDEVTLNRNIAIARSTGYSVAGAFRADVVNREFTKQLAITQQLRRDIERSIRLATFDSEGGDLTLPTGRAGKLLGFDADGDATLYSSEIDTALVSGYAATLLDDGDATTARATLGLTIGSHVQAYSAKLDSISALTSVANLVALANQTWAAGKIPYFTSSSEISSFDFTGAIVPFAGSALPSGFLACNGAAVSRTVYANLFAKLVTEDAFSAQTFTVTIASPGVFTKSGHGFLGGERVRLSTSGALPTGLSTGTDYFVKYVDANTFQVASTLDGTSINTSGSQSGVHSYLQSRYGLGDGSTTFNLPDLRDQFIRGYGSTRTLGTGQLDAFQGHQHQALPRDGLGGNGSFAYGASTQIGTATTTSTVTDGSNGTPRTANETRPVNLALNYCIKY